MPKVVTTIEHDVDESVQVYKKHKLYVPFKLFGYLDEMNIVDVMCEISTPERNLFRELLNNISETTHVSTLDFPITKTQGVKRSKIAKQLVDRGIIKKTGQRSWMINPYLVLPEKGIREIIVVQWLQL